MRRLARACFFAFAAALTAVAACSGGSSGMEAGGDDDNGGADDPGGFTDGPDGGGGEPTCAAAASYSTLPDQEAEQGMDEDGETYLGLYAELDAGDPNNWFEVSLWNGAGAFASAAVAPGTYTISGDETSFLDCGVCVTVYGDVDPATDLERQIYQAQTGTVTIDSVAGTLAGSLSDVVLVEVDPTSSTPVAGGCQTRIPSATFSATITAAMP